MTRDQLKIGVRIRFSDGRRWIVEEISPDDLVRLRRLDKGDANLVLPMRKLLSH